MKAMQCHELEDVLQQGQAAPLPADAAAHLNGCERCRSLIADLEAIRLAARELAAEEIEPPQRIWISLRNQLEAEGLIRTPGPVSQTRITSGGRWVVFWRPALAGVYVAFLAAAAVLVGLQGEFRRGRVPSNNVPTISMQIDKELANVERHTVTAFRQRDPVVAASLRENLAIVDNFIALCQKSVREQPQDQLAREYLFGAYQQKAELLASMTERGAMGD